MLRWNAKLLNQGKNPHQKPRAAALCIPSYCLIFFPGREVECIDLSSIEVEAESMARPLTVGGFRKLAAPYSVVMIN